MNDTPSRSDSRYSDWTNRWLTRLHHKWRHPLEWYHPMYRWSLKTALVANCHYLHRRHQPSNITALSYDRQACISIWLGVWAGARTRSVPYDRPTGPIVASVPPADDAEIVATVVSCVRPRGAFAVHHWTSVRSLATCSIFCANHQRKYKYG